jgi:phage baseplate assembly protein V
MAGETRGTYFLPEIGDEVLVAADSGDPSHVFVIGALWNGQQSPPTTNSDGKNNERLIRSRSGHELRFNDDASAPEVDLMLADGKHVQMDKDGIVVDDGNQNTITIESNSGAISITASQSLNLEGTTVSIQAKGSMEIKASGTLTLKGAMVQIN